jgi:DNA end-binding protein Ku
VPEANERAEAPALRPFWSGVVSFGLVNVPVNLYPASRRQRVALRMLDEDGTPLARRYFCPAEDTEVPWEEIVRGYELDEGRFVVVTDEELEGLAPQRSREIDLRRFVDLDEIDPMLFDRAYFLTPSGDTTKAYRLLAEAMEGAHRAGIATFVMRGKEYLVAIIAEGGILRAETLRFADEIRQPEDVGLPEAEDVDSQEIQRLGKEIDRHTRKTLPVEALEDLYTQRMLELVERKRKKGDGVVEAPEREGEAEESNVIDLFAELKRSLDRTEGRGRERRRAGDRGPAAAKGDLASRSKEELYERAQELDIPGRSKMSKKELIKALGGS